MRKYVVIFLGSLILAACAGRGVTVDKSMAFVEFMGIEVMPHEIDGRRIKRGKNNIIVKPGKHIISVYLDWGGYGRSSKPKIICFKAKAGQKYLVGADLDVEDDRSTESNWSPYIEQVTDGSLRTRFFSLGFKRDLLDCD